MCVGIYMYIYNIYVCINIYLYMNMFLQFLSRLFYRDLLSTLISVRDLFVSFCTVIHDRLYRLYLNVDIPNNASSFLCVRIF